MSALLEARRTAEKLWRLAAWWAFVAWAATLTGAIEAYTLRWWYPFTFAVGGTIAATFGIGYALVGLKRASRG